MTDSAAPGTGGPRTSETSRLSAHEIFDRVTAGAQEEIERPLPNLLVAAVGAGLTMGLSGLGVALLRHAGAPEPVAYLGYPLGFLIVIIGRQQLFTENTLFPVALCLEQPRYLARTAALWAVVLGGNVAGTLMFAALMVKSAALTRPELVELSRLGHQAGVHGFGTVLWTGILGGWLIALVAWLVTASTDTVGQVLIILLLTYFVGLGHFAHSVAGSTEVLTSVVAGDLPVRAFLTWFCGAVVGNAIGGVLMVALFNFGQVKAPRSG